MLTITQKKTAEAIVNIFETGVIQGHYGQVTLIGGDTGHLTYGRSQTTLGSGNLFKLIDLYCANSGARFGHRLAPFLPSLEARSTVLDTDWRLHNLLRACCDDPVMRDTQDSFFDATYWNRAATAAKREGMSFPLSVAVVYDAYIHGSWARIRDRTNDAVGKAEQAGEKKWVSAYVDERQAWLGGHRRADLRSTVYRMEAFRRLIEQDLWDLALPIVVRGLEISESALNARPPGCYDGPHPGTRALMVASPMFRGLDVRLMQLGLAERGVAMMADGIYGRTSARCVREFQQANGLPVTGTADAALVAELSE